MSRTIRAVIAALVLLAIVAVVGATLWLGTLVKTAIERVGSHVTGTSVKLDHVDISLLRGLVQLDRLEIGNPPGFTAPSAIKLGTARVRLDVRSVLSDTIVIDEVLVEAPDITFEGFPRSNLSAIQENVKTAVPEGSAKPAESAGRLGTKKLLIKSFTLSNGRVAASVGGQSLRLSLPNIHLADIGKETGGATPEQVASAVFSAITRSATGAVTDQTKKAGDTVNKAAENIQKLFK
jgi:uncharacterized protein involved in outer membrane biogenesis